MVSMAVGSFAPEGGGGSSNRSCGGGGGGCGSDVLRLHSERGGEVAQRNHGRGIELRNTWYEQNRCVVREGGTVESWAALAMPRRRGREHHERSLRADNTSRHERSALLH